MGTAPRTFTAANAANQKSRTDGKRFRILDDRPSWLDIAKTIFGNRLSEHPQRGYLLDGHPISAIDLLAMTKIGEVNV